MLATSARFISMITPRIAKPASTNSVILYSWSPGYKIPQKYVDTNGVEKIKKIFVPTSTFEAALSFLKNEYGNREYLKFKDDAHPGHSAIETGSSYLSAGTTDPISAIDLKSKHPIVFASRLEADLISFTRIPETILDFYTLDSTQVNKAIAQFKDSQLIYSLLGDRLYKTEGESCATTAFIALEAGGIENLLRADQWLLSKRGILSPALLASYASKARDREHDLHPESIELSDQLIPARKD